MKVPNKLKFFLADYQAVTKYFSFIFEKIWWSGYKVLTCPQLQHRSYQLLGLMNALFEDWRNIVTNSGTLTVGQRVSEWDSTTKTVTPIGVVKSIRKYPSGFSVIINTLEGKIKVVTKTSRFFDPTFMVADRIQPYL